VDAPAAMQSQPTEPRSRTVPACRVTCRRWSRKRTSASPIIGSASTRRGSRCSLSRPADALGAFQQWPRLVAPAHAFEQTGEITQVHRNLRVVWPVDLLIDGERAFVKTARGGIVFLRAQNIG